MSGGCRRAGARRAGETYVGLLQPAAQPDAPSPAQIAKPKIERRYESLSFQPLIRWNYLLSGAARWLSRLRLRKRCSLRQVSAVPYKPAYRPTTICRAKPGESPRAPVPSLCAEPEQVPQDLQAVRCSGRRGAVCGTPLGAQGLRGPGQASRAAVGPARRPPVLPPPAGAATSPGENGGLYLRLP